MKSYATCGANHDKPDPVPPSPGIVLPLPLPFRSLMGNPLGLIHFILVLVGNLLTPQSAIQNLVLEP